jgi:acyl carrier protein
MPEFEDEDNLFETGAVDSFLLLELVYSLGMAYGVTIELSDLDPDQVSSIRGLYTVFGGVTA